MPGDIFGGSAAAGNSSINGPAAGGSGQPNEPDYKSQYAELEKKLGEMGNELGQWRSFYNDIEPVLDKLRENPDALAALRDGLLTADLAKAIVEGKATVAEAQEAKAEIKTEIGAKNFGKLTPEEVAKLVEEKVSESNKKLHEELAEKDEMRDFVTNVDQFLASHGEFQDPNFVEAVEQWLENHDVDDIEVAYYAVKGHIAEQMAGEESTRSGGERAKELAMMAGGGSSQRTAVIEDNDLLDTLIAPVRNPNSIF